VRRSRRGSDSARTELLAGPLRLDEERHLATLDGRSLDLTALEFALLAELLRAKGRVRTREQLLERISDRRFDGFDRSIDVHISALRRKLGDDPKSPRFIRTIRGVGYLLAIPASKLS
jgi:DNA-binding response OmpR family regulator